MDERNAGVERDANRRGSPWTRAMPAWNALPIARQPVDKRNAGVERDADTRS